MKSYYMNLLAAIFIAFFSVADVFANNNLRVVTLQVEGMISPACPVLLKSAVVDIDGVKNIQPSLETRSATIEFDEEQASL